MTDAALRRFSSWTMSWFEEAFGAPTWAQAEAWEAISSGEHTLVIAPTGSGKTLAAFLSSIDRLIVAEATEPRCRVVYISPLKALAADIEKNLREPLAGIRRLATERGETVNEVNVAVRSGDTPADERRRFAKHPADILITTPESFYLLLTSAARDALTAVDTVIIDEIHSLAGTKRGAHLALSLERLDARLARPAQRIGLSATVRPPEEVARFLAGGRPVTLIAPPAQKRWDLRVTASVPDLGDLTALSGLAVPGSQAAPSSLFTAYPAPLPAGASPFSEPAGQAPPSARSVSGIETAPNRVSASKGRGGENAPRRKHHPSIWPSIIEQLVDLIVAHRSTLVFVNSRQVAERVTARVNEVWAARLAPPPEDGLAMAPHSPIIDPATPLPSDYIGHHLVAQNVPGAPVHPSEPGDLSGPTLPSVLAQSHHGSMSHERRHMIEEALKAGQLRAVVATSSLELGIDMGAVDLVVQIGTPMSVASGLQRVGRAGHQVGAVSHAILFPTFPGDLVALTTTARRMADGAIEETTVIDNPLDVLAQQIVAAVALDVWKADDLFALVRRSAPFTALPRSLFDAVVEMLAGAYPGEEFAGLRPRLWWDRAEGTLTARRAARHLAVVSGGTIPDRGLYPVFVDDGSVTGPVASGPAAGVDSGSEGPSGPGPREAGGETSEPERDEGEASGRARRPAGRRVGELEEIMVFESRVGDIITLGSSTWQITAITPEQVLVSPAPGAAGRLPFWHGDGLGRPAELGRAIGEFARTLGDIVAAESSDEAGSPEDDSETTFGAAGAAAAFISIAPKPQMDDSRPQRSPGDHAATASSPAPAAPDRNRGDGSASAPSAFSLTAVETALLGDRPIRLGAWTTSNLLRYVREQREHAGIVPDDRTIVVETFPDEMGDRRVVICSPYGGRVHHPWALLIAARVRDQHGIDIQAMAADEGIVLRLPASAPPEPGDDELVDGPRSSGVASPSTPSGHHGFARTSRAPSISDDHPSSAEETWAPPSSNGDPFRDLADLIVFPPEAVAGIVQEELAQSALFATRFRQACARALLLPRKAPGHRQPLWQQRNRAAHLLTIAARYPRFPMMLEAARECLHDDFDLDALTGLMAAIGRREITVAAVETPSPSPFARSVLFYYSGVFMYEEDAPLSQMRATVLALDPDLLAELLGADPDAALAWLDTDVFTEVERDLQRLSSTRLARDAEDVFDCLRLLGPLSLDDLAERTRPDLHDEIVGWLTDLESHGHITRLRGRWLTLDDAVRWSDIEASPVACSSDDESAELSNLVTRYARTHVPFTVEECARCWGIESSLVAVVVERLVETGQLKAGSLRPPRWVTVDRRARAGDEDEEPPSTDPSPERVYADPAVFVRIQRRCLAKARAAIEPVSPTTYARFLPSWQGVGGSLRGIDGLSRVVEQLAGAVVPASALESFILPARLPDYRPADLDTLMAAGEVTWRGHGSLAGGDGWISLAPADLSDAFAAPSSSAPLPEASLSAMRGSEFPVDDFSSVHPGTAHDAGLNHTRPVSSLPDPVMTGPLPPLEQEILAFLSHGGAFRSGDIAAALNLPPSAGFAEALWSLVWAGLVSCDTLAPLRSRLAGARPAHRIRRPAPRHRYGRVRLSLPAPVAVNSGELAGRWSLNPGVAPEASHLTTREALREVRLRETERALTRAEVLLDRYGILTRPAVATEKTPGGFAAVTRVLTVAEQQGHVHRGAFIRDLGASQFATSGAIDLLRRSTSPSSEPSGLRDHPEDAPENVDSADLRSSPATASVSTPTSVADRTSTSSTAPAYAPAPAKRLQPSSDGVLILAATDPANPYGAILPWPERSVPTTSHPVVEQSAPTSEGESPISESATTESSHRPARKAGALVVLLDGALAAYIERGGRSVLTWPMPDDALPKIANALAGLVTSGRLDQITITTIDGVPVLSPEPLPLSTILQRSGFTLSPQGLRLRR
ncbi:MAG: DEAD/DEAH box helicase [Propionibacteriaceae bacterium]|jgi:ATP-dependent Lhr-like helicase|nr:DEAD/DEAH box helicase [Propionibacteriaceae bacterium]